MKKSRKAFTLVELLIVIVVIGILAGMMMLAGGEATSSAEAAKIIGNMTQIKKAVHLWFLDNSGRVIKGKSGDGKKTEYYIDKVGKDGYPSAFIAGKGAAEIMKYISNGSSITLKSKNSNKKGDYIVTAVENSTKWYACYNLGDSDSRLKEKLAAKQSSANLKGAADVKDGNKPITTNYKDQKYVCIIVLELSK